MAMVVDRALALMVLAWAELRTAMALGLVDEDEASLPPDVAALIGASTSHAKALRDFRRAYGAWWLFHAKIDAEEKSGKLSREETFELLHLIDERDAKRQALIDLVES